MLSSRFNENNFINLRKKIKKAIKKNFDSLGVIVVALENNNDIRSPLEASLDETVDSNILIHILGEEYGSIPNGYKESFTHLEYKVAIKNNITILAYPIGDIYCSDLITYSLDENFKEWQKSVLLGEHNAIINKKFPTKYDSIEIIHQIIIDISLIFNLAVHNLTKNNNYISPINKNIFSENNENIKNIEFVKIVKNNIIKYDIFISKDLVTTKLYNQVMKTSHDTSSKYISNIMWIDAIDFCNKLSILFQREEAYIEENNLYKINLNSNGFRLLSLEEFKYIKNFKEQTNYSEYIEWGSDIKVEYQGVVFNYNNLKYSWYNKKLRDVNLSFRIIYKGEIYSTPKVKTI